VTEATPCASVRKCHPSDARVLPAFVSRDDYMAIGGIATAAGLASLLWVGNGGLRVGLEIGCGTVALAALIMMLVRWNRGR
jgi:hypothetical protein